MNHHQQVPEDDAPSNCTDAPILGNPVDHNGTNENGPDYKDQCRPSSYRTVSSSTAATTPSLEVAVRSTDGPTNLASDLSCHIPIVCGVPVPDEAHAVVEESVQASRSVPHTIQFEPLHQRHRNETASSDMDACPERAPPTSDSSSSRKSSRSSHSSLSQQERKYWIRVITCSVIVNTLLVLAVVVGGVCGTVGCRFSTVVSPGNTTDLSVDGNQIDSPTPSPSQRRISSFAPTAAFTSPPTLFNQSLPPTVSSDEVAQPLDPALGPLEVSLAPSPSPSPISLHPIVNFSKPDEYSSSPEDSVKAEGFPIVLLIPIAIFVDLLLVICYIYFRHKRWIKVRNTFSDGSMTSLDEMHSLRSVNF
jgi:hypothetical protein